MHEHKSYTHTFDADLLFGIWIYVYMFPFLLKLAFTLCAKRTRKLFCSPNRSFIIQSVGRLVNCNEAPANQKKKKKMCILEVAKAIILRWSIVTNIRWFLMTFVSTFIDRKNWRATIRWSKGVNFENFDKFRSNVSTATF